MSELKLAMPTIFTHEGRYVNNPSDPGGMTNFGISLKFLLQTGDLDKDGWLDGDVNRDGKLTSEDIRAMKEPDAARLYDLYFWSKQCYGVINDQSVATKVFDFAVNMGSVGANRCLQRAVRAANSSIILLDDGVFGAKTQEAVNMASPIKLLAALKSEAAGYYRSIKFKGSQDFLKGWLNRAYSDMV